MTPPIHAGAAMKPDPTNALHGDPVGGPRWVLVGRHLLGYDSVHDSVGQQVGRAHALTALCEANLGLP
ncbi:MAG TPA: hypothetical protein VFH94_03955 [Streptomyces sp.]|nr:hypothetical protein [Streptomyces sp.]